MLEKIDLKSAISKKEYKQKHPELFIRLGELQRATHDEKIPTIIVFEGLDGAGKGTNINKLMQPLDPRGFKVHPISEPTEDEKFRPFLWRFWTKLPANGRIAIFDRSWYGRVLVEKVDNLVRKKTWRRAYDEILQFERQLTDGGAVIVKFWLHIDKKEQGKRFRKLEKDPATSWKVTEMDWKHHKQYEKYLDAIEAMLAKTSTAYAPWTIVESTQLQFASIKIFETLVYAWENALEAKKNKPEAVKSTGVRKLTAASSILNNVDLSEDISREEYKENLPLLQNRVRELEHLIYKKRVPVMIVYEGWDAGGKGGNIRRLTAKMDPRGFEVVPIAAPNDEEIAHHYLWRFWRQIPKGGHITIYDRSWYGRVLVERVEGFCSAEEWQRAYQEINEFEAQLVADVGVLIKFWLQISKDEQLRRFEARKVTPSKQWKITDEDWRNRERWDLYESAVEEMLQRTSTAYAPWTILKANSKHFARITALRTFVEALEKAAGG